MSLLITTSQLALQVEGSHGTGTLPPSPFSVLSLNRVFGCPPKLKWLSISSTYPCLQSPVVQDHFFAPTCPSPSFRSVSKKPPPGKSLSAWTVGPNSKTVKKASPVPCFNLDRLLAGHLLANYRRVASAADVVNALRLRDFIHDAAAAAAATNTIHQPLYLKQLICFRQKIYSSSCDFISDVYCWYLIFSIQLHGVIHQLWRRGLGVLQIGGPD